LDTNPNYLSPVDFERAMNAIPTLNIRNWEDEDVEYLFRIMYNLALRPSEAVVLRREDFDLRNRMCYLGKTKTQSHGKVTIPSWFVDDLERWLAFKREGRLWPDLTYKPVWRWLKKLGKDLNIQPWLDGNRSKTGELTVGHIFRKSLGKDLLDQGKTINIISKHLRHTDITTTYNYYLKADEKAVHDAL